LADGMNTVSSTKMMQHFTYQVFRRQAARIVHFDHNGSNNSICHLDPAAVVMNVGSLIKLIEPHIYSPLLTIPEHVGTRPGIRRSIPERCRPSIRHLFKGQLFRLRNLCCTGFASLLLLVVFFPSYLYLLTVDNLNASVQFHDTPQGLVVVSTCV